MRLTSSVGSCPRPCTPRGVAPGGRRRPSSALPAPRRSTCRACGTARTRSSSFPGRFVGWFGWFGLVWFRWSIENTWYKIKTSCNVISDHTIPYDGIDMAPKFLHNLTIQLKNLFHKTQKQKKTARTQQNNSSSNNNHKINKHSNNNNKHHNHNNHNKQKTPPWSTDSRGGRLGPTCSPPSAAGKGKPARSFCRPRTGDPAASSAAAIQSPAGEGRVGEATRGRGGGEVVNKPSSGNGNEGDQQTITRITTTTATPKGIKETTTTTREGMKNQQQ